MLVKTFLANSGVTEILCIFKLKGKTGKEIPKSLRFEVLEIVLANNFAINNLL